MPAPTLNIGFNQGPKTLIAATGKFAAAAPPINLPSPSGTTIPAAAHIIDRSLNMWTVIGGVVYQNGSPAGTSSNVILLLFYNNNIYYENSSDAWFQWNGSSWVSISGDPRSMGMIIRVGSGGIFVNGSGTQVNLIGTAMVGTEECQGYANNTAGRIAGIAAVTSANYTSAIAAGVATLAGAAKPYGQVNMIRVLLNSALWMGFTGRDPFGNAAGNYFAAGTDSAGNALYSGGTGGGPGSGQGHETSGNPSAYQTYIKNEVAAILGAGLYVLLDLHWGTPTLTSTNQYVLPAGQPAMPGPADVLFWTSIAQTFGTQNATTGSGAIMFELYNEPYGSGIYANQVGTEAAYLGSQTLTQFAFPTATTSPNGTGGGYQMENNVGSGGGPILGGVTCYAVGFQQIINAIRATGAQNVIAVGCQNYTGEVETWSQNGGQMVVTDSINQIASAFHAYGYRGGTGNFVTLQNAGIPHFCTELGDLANATGANASYVGYVSQGWGYTWLSWNNYGSSANIYTSGGMTGANTAWSGNGAPVPTGSN
jgi:hypothetical protein